MKASEFYKKHCKEKITQSAFYRFLKGCSEDCVIKHKNRYYVANEQRLLHLLKIAKGI